MQIFNKKAQLKDVSSYEDTLRLTFNENKILIDASCFWKVIDNNNIVFTSSDFFIKNNDENQFNLIFKKIIKKLKKTELIDIRLQENENKLSFIFSNNMIFDFFSSSIKYESWSLNINNKKYVCLGGGEIAVWE